MNFSTALEALKKGKIAFRDGWNGKGMYVAYMPAKVVPAEFITEETQEQLPREARHKPLKVGGYFVVWTADKTWQPGWVASQADLLADDWSTQSSPDFPAR